MATPRFRERKGLYPFSNPLRIDYACVACGSVVDHPSQGCHHCGKIAERKQASLQKLLAAQREGAATRGDEA